MLVPWTRVADWRPARVVLNRAGKPPRLALAQLPPPGQSPNPYADLLYRALADEGLPRATFPGLSIRALWRCRRTVAVLHFHWRPDHAYAPCLSKGRMPEARRRLQANVELWRFAVRLVCARVLGYRIAWTVHETQPPRHARIDRMGQALLARASSVLMAHDRAVADQLRDELGYPLQIEIVPHGTFKGVYAVKRSAEEVRRELGIPTDAFVFLCFGQVRSDKEIPFLLDAFSTADIQDAYLVIAGDCHHPPSGRRVEAAALRDGRIRAMLHPITADRVGELFGMADAFVLARSRVWTSGSLILALSHGVPVVAPRLPPVMELLDDESAGWLFEPGDVGSLAQTLDTAAHDRAGAAAKRSAARLRGEEIPAWSDVAQRTVRAFGPL
jgi:beta-1,4-mannosyltransferase